MKTTTQLILTLLLLSGTTFSQDITKWIEQHPHVLLINSKDASTEFLEKLDEASAGYIIYTDEVSSQDIELYEQNQFSKGSLEHIDYNSGDAEFVKMWLALNPEVKIIPHDIFESMSTTEQLSYQSKGSMILDGNVITLSDIERYEDLRTEILSK